MNEQIQFLGNLFTTPYRTDMPQNPADLQMDYEDVTIIAPDGVKLKAWYIPSDNSNKLILMTHPMMCTRYGYVPPESLMNLLPLPVKFLPVVKHLNDAGYNVLFMDFRNHGMSESGSNGVCGIGHFESQDVIGLMQYVKNNERLNGMSKAFLSHCMGANATIKAISEQPELFEDIKAMISVQALSADVALRQLIKMQMPDAKEENVLNEVDAYMKENKGMSLYDASPRQYVKDIKVPVLYVQVKKDILTSPTDTQEFYDKTNAEKELFWIMDDETRFFGYNYFGIHPEKMLEFFSKHVN